MFCSKCGKELPEGVIFCSNCGRQIEEGNIGVNNVNHQTDKVKEIFSNIISEDEGKKLGNKIAGLISLAIGAIIEIIAVITYSNDTSKFLGGYTYTSPLTTHEIGVIIGIVTGVCLLAWGLILMVASSRNRK